MKKIKSVNVKEKWLEGQVVREGLSEATLSQECNDVKSSARGGFEAAANTKF